MRKSSTGSRAKKALTPAQRGALTRAANRAAREREAAELFARRSAAAKRGAETRAANVAARARETKQSRRSQRARRGWETRRANEALRERQTFKVNEEDPSAGGWQFKLYEDTHPTTGLAEEVAKWSARAAPYYGKRIKLTVNGYRIDPDTGERAGRIFISRIGAVNQYGDVFGPGSLYSRILRAIVAAGSEAELVIISLTIELAAPDDDDAEEI